MSWFPEPMDKLMYNISIIRLYTGLPKRGMLHMHIHFPIGPHPSFAQKRGEGHVTERTPPRSTYVSACVDYCCFTILAPANSNIKHCLSVCATEPRIIVCGKAK